MSDVDHERLAVPVAHSVFSQHTNPSSYSGASAAPPFAPRPHYGQQVRQQQRLHSTTGSSRSGTTSDRIPPPPSAECNIHEVCHYFQQAVFILAILTGIALVIAGAVLHVQNGELLVLVYIGVLLGAVNSVLLTIQCCVRRKQKKRAHRTARHSQGTPAVVRYDPLSNPLLSAATVPPPDVQQYHYKHYHIHPPPSSQQAFQDFPGMLVQSEPRILHRSGHRLTYQKSPPLGPLHNTFGPQHVRSEGNREAYKADDLLRCGRHTQDGTTVHLI